MKKYFTDISVIPDNDAARITALRRYEILDTPPENAFNNIVNVACRAFNIPIALVSFVDKDRVFFKANKGMAGINNVDREKSICSLAVLNDEVTVFENALKEPCLLSNPLVIGEFGLRFYAGAPLKTHDGYNIGTLCIIDKNIRSFSDDDREILENLASIVMDEIELRISSIKAVRAKQELLDLSVQKNQELLKKNNDLDNFIYTASHDLKAPVSNIEGLIHSLNDTLNAEGKNEEVTTVIDHIENSISIFKNTIKDLTEISKQKNREENLSNVSIPEVVDDIKTLIDDLIKDSNAVIETDFSGSQMVEFSKANFQSILYNLVNNAIKYRSPERSPKIEIRTEKTKEYVILYVKDNGLGISQDNLEKVFEMFQRIHDHVEGSGVGLSLIKRIIENSGGKIELESEVGKGSVFKVYFKLH